MENYSDQVKGSLRSSSRYLPWINIGTTYTSGILWQWSCTENLNHQHIFVYIKASNWIYGVLVLRARLHCAQQQLGVASHDLEGPEIATAFIVCRFNDVEKLGHHTVRASIGSLVAMAVQPIRWWGSAARQRASNTSADAGANLFVSQWRRNRMFLCCCVLYCLSAHLLRRYVLQRPKPWRAFEVPVMWFCFDPPLRPFPDDLGVLFVPGWLWIWSRHM